MPAPAAGARSPLPRDDPRRAGDMAPANHRGQGPYGLNLCQTGASTSCLFFQMRERVCNALRQLVDMCQFQRKIDSKLGMLAKTKILITAFCDS